MMYYMIEDARTTEIAAWRMEDGSPRMVVARQWLSDEIVFAGHHFATLRRMARELVRTGMDAVSDQEGKAHYYLEQYYGVKSILTVTYDGEKTVVDLPSVKKILAIMDDLE